MSLASMEKDPQMTLHYKLLQENEHHFNNLQAGYRKLASGWLLAVFAGIGFVLTDLPNKWEGYMFLFIALILMAGAIGIFLLSVIDLKVYHSLLVANTRIGEEMEEAFGALLPPIHQMMRKAQDETVHRKAILFYQVPVILLLLISGICMAIYFGDWGGWLVFISSVIHLGLIVILSRLMS